MTKPNDHLSQPIIVDGEEVWGKGPAPMHLADLIHDEMEVREWSLDDLIMNMGPFYTEHDWAVCQLSWEMFFAVREPCVVLGDVMAQQLGDAFGITPKFFTNFHELWRRSVAKAEVINEH